MARYAPVALVAALLVATSLAFVYTERLKLTPSPILGTRVDKVFSPVCDCETNSAEIAFRLRQRDVVTIEIVDADDDRVATVLGPAPRPRGPLSVRWDGRDDDGRVVAEGAYRPRVHLDRARRTIVLPNEIRVDTTPPVIRLVSLRPRVLSPDGDRRSDRLAAAYETDEPAVVALFVDGRQEVRKRGRKQQGTITWPGSGDARPEPGVYAISLRARDVAGNPSRRTPPRPVVVRYVALGRDALEARPGRRFAVFVSSDAARVEWRLGRRSGSVPPGTLRLRAPLQPGRYTLVVSANGSEARAAVFVRRAAP